MNFFCKKLIYLKNNDEKSKQSSFHDIQDKIENRFKKNNEKSLDVKLSNLNFKKKEFDLSKEKSFLHNKSMANDIQLAEKSLLSSSLNVVQGSINFSRYIPENKKSCGGSYFF